MRYKVFISVFIGSVLSIAMRAQNNVYIRACVGKKVGKSFTNYFSPPAFTFQSNKWAWDKGIDISSFIGYRFNKNRSTVELGIKYQKNLSAWRISFNKYDPTNNQFAPAQINFHKEIPCIQIPLLLSTQVAYWDSIRIIKSSKLFSIHFNTLLGISLYQRNLLYAKHDINQSFLLDQNQQIEINSYSYATTYRHRIIPQLGLSIEIRKSNTEWGALYLYAQINKHISNHFRRLLFQDINISITDLTTAEKSSYYLIDEGYPIYFCIELSKKIFLKRKNNIRPAK